MGTQRNESLRSKTFSVAAVHDPASRRRKSPIKPASLPTLFPDEDHAYQPRRRVQVTKLQHNILPPPSPRTASPSPSAVRRKLPGFPHQRLANIVDSKLWGFPVKYSPSQELSDAWKKAELQQSQEIERQQQEEQVRLRHHQQKQIKAELERRDYSLYLYLASKYGALDAILYCCTPYPGRLYALLIDQSARRLQRWRGERLAALRNYWVVVLSRDVVRASFVDAFAHIQRAAEHQRNAAVFLHRLRWRFATRAFRSWFEFAQRQIEVRWRFQFALREDLRGRFVHWRNRIAEMKLFKKQLKQVARRKQMQLTFAQWMEWQAKQQRLRIHIQQQWTKLQRQCLAAWRAYSLACQQERQAATKTQRRWRGHRERQRHSHRRVAAKAITKAAKGCLARRYVANMRAQMLIAEALERIVRSIEWEDVADSLRVVRRAAIEKEIRRAACEAKYIDDAERDAIAFVKSELGKVRKNDMHQRLQRLTTQLQERGLPGDEHRDSRGPRTADALTHHATELLIQEAASAARQQAHDAFLAQRDGDESMRHAQASADGQCVVCAAAASFLLRSSPPWLPAPPRCKHAPASSPAQILADASAADEAFSRSLLVSPIAGGNLWRRLPLLKK